MNTSNPIALFQQTPIPADRIDAMVSEYDAERHELARLLAALQSSRGAKWITVSGTEKAAAQIRTSYWTRVLDDFELRAHMCADDRDRWEKGIREVSCPPFEYDTVYHTIAGLYAQRPLLAANRVDAVFRGLSSVHVTNSPLGFRQRMIIENFYSDSSYCRKDSLLEDLYIVWHQWQGLPEPDHRQWVEIKDQLVWVRRNAPSGSGWPFVCGRPGGFPYGR